MDVLLNFLSFRTVFLSICVLLLILMIEKSYGYSINDTDTLYKNLLLDYNSYTRGIDRQEDPVYVSLTFNLVSINGFDELIGKISAVAFFNIFWEDQRMTWDPAHYNGAKNILFPQNSVWKPFIILGNPHESIEAVGSSGDEFFIEYSSNGIAKWQPGDLFEFSCFPDVKYYPYDTQTCTAQFLPWGYSKHNLRLNLLFDSVDLSLFEQNGVWQLTETRIWIEEYFGNFEVLKIQLELKRRSFFYMINMILPIGGMGLLNIFVFLLPSESGERVGYSITVLLAIAVFQTIASDNLPKSSYPSVAALCFKLLADFAISCLVMIFTIISLRVYNIDSSRPVPSCLANVTNFFLCRWCCSKRKFNRGPFVDHGKIEHPPSNGKAEFNWTPVENGKKSTDGDIYEDDTKLEVTWTDVGLLMDGIFASLSFIAFVGSNVFFIVYVSNA